MKSYITYLFRKKYGRILRIFLIYAVPIIISGATLVISIKSREEANKHSRDAKRVVWEHAIDLVDTASISQKITFSSKRSDVALRDLNVFLPYPLESQFSGITKGSWNCTVMQMDIANAFSKFFECDETYLLPASASTRLLYTLPVVLQLNYVIDGELASDYCYYEIKFRYFTVGRVKIYAANFVCQIYPASEQEIQNLLDYKNRVEGFFSAEFAMNGSIDSVNSKGAFADLSAFLVSLRDKRRIEFFKESQPWVNYMVDFPNSIDDSLDAAGNIQYLNSQIKNYSNKPAYKKIYDGLVSLSEWINYEAFCFVYQSTTKMEDCIINSPWGTQTNYKNWLDKLGLVLLEIYKASTKDPLQQMRQL